jgi:outer membrane protein assembly factor BamB
MASVQRTLEAARSGLLVLLLGGCLMEPPPDCQFTSCGTEEGTITAVTTDGSPAWSTTVRDAAESGQGADPLEAPVVIAHGGHVVVDGCRAVHVLDAATGAVLAENETMDRVWTVTDDLVVGSVGDVVTNEAGPDAGSLMALPLAGADPAWVRLPYRGQAVQGVVEVGEGLAVLSGGLVHVLRPGGPTTLVTLAEAVSAPAGSAPALVRVDGRTVAVLHDDGTVEAVDTTSGRSVWTIGSSAPARTARAGHLGEDLLLSWGSSTAGEVARVTPDGTVTWRAEGALPQPVVLDRAATVVPVQKQYLTAVDATNGEPLSLAAHPRPANDVPVLSGPQAVGWTAAGIGTTSAWSTARPTGEPVWSRQGAVVGAAGDEAVLLTGRTTPRSLTAVSVTGTEVWRLPVRHDGLTVTAVPSMGAVVSDLAVEVIRSQDCEDYPARHTVPVTELP